MKSVLSSLLLLAATAFALSATDLTGKWSGTFDMKQDGEAQTIPVIMVVKQDGDKITGTAGTEDDQHPIQNGKVDGNKVTLEVDSGEALYYLELEVDGDSITGKVKLGADGEPMKIALKRVKES